MIGFCSVFMEAVYVHRIYHYYCVELVHDVPYWNFYINEVQFPRFATSCLIKELSNTYVAPNVCHHLIFT